VTIQTPLVLTTNREAVPRLDIRMIRISRTVFEVRSLYACSTLILSVKVAAVGTILNLIYAKRAIQVLVRLE
jgi:hypothetical protein